MDFLAKFFTGFLVKRKPVSFLSFRLKGNQVSALKIESYHYGYMMVALCTRGPRF